MSKREWLVIWKRKDRRYKSRALLETDGSARRLFDKMTDWEEYEDNDGYDFVELRSRPVGEWSSHETWKLEDEEQ